MSSSKQILVKSMLCLCLVAGTLAFTQCGGGGGSSLVGNTPSSTQPVSTEEDINTLKEMFEDELNLHIIEEGFGQGKNYLGLCGKETFGSHLIKLNTTKYRKLGNSIKTWDLDDLEYQVFSNSQFKFNYKERAISPDIAFSYDGKVVDIRPPYLHELDLQVIHGSQTDELVYTGFFISGKIKSETRSAQTGQALIDYSPKIIINNYFTYFNKLVKESEREMGTFTVGGSYPWAIKKISGFTDRGAGQNPRIVPVNRFTTVHVAECAPPQNLDIAYVSFQPKGDTIQKIQLEELTQYNEFSSFDPPQYVYFDIIPNQGGRDISLGDVVLSNNESLLIVNQQRTADEKTRFKSALGWVVGFPKSSFQKGKRYTLHITSNWESESSPFHPPTFFEYSAERNSVGGPITGYRKGCQPRFLYGQQMPDFCNKMRLGPTVKDFQFEIAP